MAKLINLTLNICAYEQMSRHVCMQSVINIAMLYRGGGGGSSSMHDGIEYCIGEMGGASGASTVKPL